MLPAFDNMLACKVITATLNEKYCKVQSAIIIINKVLILSLAYSVVKLWTKIVLISFVKSEHFLCLLLY